MSKMTKNRSLNMSQGLLCPNLTQKVQKKVSQIANRNLPSVMLLGGLSVNLNHLKPPKNCNLCWLYRLKQLSGMIGQKFFQNETKVPHSQSSFHRCRGLVHNILNLYTELLLQVPAPINQANQQPPPLSATSA